MPWKKGEMGLERQDEKGRRGAACGPQSIQREENAGGGERREAETGLESTIPRPLLFPSPFFVFGRRWEFFSPSPPLSMLQQTRSWRQLRSSGSVPPREVKGKKNCEGEWGRRKVVKRRARKEHMQYPFFFTC